MIHRVIELDSQGVVEKKVNIQLSQDEIYYALTELDRAYSEKMSSHRDLMSYSEKLFCNANFVVCREQGDILGILAYYTDVNTKKAYIPYICVSVNSRGKGIASKMMQAMIDGVVDYCESIELEVRDNNINAILLYEKFGFKENGVRGAKVSMRRSQ